MALMSMASWAATDITGSDFAVRAKHTVTYGTEISAADFQVRDVTFQSDLTATTDYTVEGVYTNSSCTLEADYPYEVGTVYVKLEGAGNYTGTKTASISITPKEIYVALKWNADALDNPTDAQLVTTPLTKTYGADDPTFKLDWSQTDFVEAGGLDDTDIEGTPVLAAHSNDVAWSEPEAPALPEVIGVEIELEGLTSQNYVIKLDPAFETEADPLDFTKMIINPKNLTALEVPAASLAISEVYQGKVIDPSFAITDGEYTLSEENGDITIEYTSEADGAGRNVDAEPWGVKITGVGNYTGTLDATVAITPAPMRVAVKNIKVPYKGAAYNAAYLAGLTEDLDEDNDPEYVYYGFVGEDAAAEASAAISATITPALVLTIDTEDGTAIDANTEGYALAINVDAVDLANYELEALESQGKLIIEKAKVTITANQARAQVYGKAETPIGYTVAYATPVAARRTAGADTPDDDSDDVYEKVFSTEPVFTHDEITGINDYDITLVSAGVATANFEVTKYVVTEYNEAGTARIDGTPVYSVIAAPITVVVLNHNKTYGQADPEELAAPVAGTDYIVSGLDDTSVLAGMTLTREDDSENVGEYELKAVLAEDMGDNFTLTCIPGKLIINPKELKVTAKAQTLAVGDDEEDLDLSAYTIDSSTPLVGEDEADAVFALAFDYVPATEETYEPVDVTADTYNSFEALYVEVEPETYELDETGVFDGEQTYYILVEAQEASGSLKDNIDPATEELVLDEGKEEQSFNQGIIVKLLSPNYKLVATAGKLTVIDATELVLLDDATDLSELEASEGPVKVTFASRELKANAWNTLWLPFNTTVKEVSSALGYALVDMLQEDATSDELNFKIHIGEIPAYTPFLVKTAEDVDMAEVKMKGEIVAPVEANMTMENKSYQFKSNLKSQVIGEPFWTTGKKMEDGGFVFSKYKATATLKALRAFVIAKEGVSAAPIFNI